MSMSAFKPSNKFYYQVTHFRQFEQKEQPAKVSSTPVARVLIAQSPSPRSVLKASPNKPRSSKKKWSSTLKKIAVAKAKEIGLTKATRYLQVNYPKEFAELAPSTLQYWIQKAQGQAV